jgi:hypothetical protein
MHFLKLIKFGWMMRRLIQAQRRSRKQIKTEARDDLFNETLEFMAQHQIYIESDVPVDPEENLNPINKIENLLKQLSSYEIEYRLMPEKLRVYPATCLVTVVLSQARKALDMLAEINKDNKKIAYYENNKNSSLDKLIKHWTGMLDGKNENKLSHIQSRREIEVRRMLAQMKKRHPDHINFYLLLFADIRNDEFFQAELKNDKLDHVINDILDFFEVGHATPDMIYKSLALQIYELYKGMIPIKELKEIIAKIIEYSFGKEYQNFLDFDKKTIFLKNVVGDFGIFDLDDLQNQRYRNRIAKIFIKNMMKSNPFLKHSMYNKFFDNMRSNPPLFQVFTTIYEIFRFFTEKFLKLPPKITPYFGFLPNFFSWLSRKKSTYCHSDFAKSLNSTEASVNTYPKD